MNKLVWTMNIAVQNSKPKYSPYDATELDAINLEIFRREINESEEAKNTCLLKLKTSLKELDDDLDCCLDEEFLLRFLRVSKFDREKALKRIQNFYSYQEKFLNAFKNCSLSVSRAQKYRFTRVCPLRLENNSPVVITRPGIVDFSKLSIDEKQYLDIILAFHLTSNPITQICGINLIIDFNGFGFQAVRVYVTRSLRLFLEFLVNAVPFRVLSIHCINLPSVYPKMYMLVKPFLPKKIQDRLHFHPNNNNWKSLHAYIPPDVLPEEYGGYNPRFTMIDLLDDVEQKELAFREYLKFGHKKTKCLRENWNCIQLHNQLL